MNNRVRRTTFRNAFIVVSVLGVLLMALIIWAYMYYFHITEPAGLSLASWPATYTNDFEFRIDKNDNGDVFVTDSGIKELDDYDLWVQIMDEEGREVYSHNKPDICPDSYTVSEFYSFSDTKFENGYTCFVSACKLDGETFDYIMGFPYEIGKFSVFYNAGAISRIGPLVRVVFLGAIAFGLILIVIYVFRFSGHLIRIEEGIAAIHERKYSNKKEKGPFVNVYKALNELNDNIVKSDAIQKSTDEKRNEWIANITHDLKTPLAPIKGYAEMLESPEKLSKEEIGDFGRTIFKNVDYAEHLINDLKLTYQMDFKELPINKEKIAATRFVKEIVIDLINNPSFAERDTEFDGEEEEIYIEADKTLLRRAIENLITNALVHNPKDTKVCVRVKGFTADKLMITVEDNGTGMSKEETDRLFDRYYRGGNTAQKAGGTGLGMAIARQIIEQAEGTIEVESAKGQGTKITVLLPVIK
ncbi:MAG: HAMP domain-containing histidine kinase [Lachnospiraceae bacterium]|nr:HAMP domain-containing histidine kinase [Lachnospiraceae bacterium]